MVLLNEKVKHQGWSESLHPRAIFATITEQRPHDCGYSLQKTDNVESARVAHEKAIVEKKELFEIYKFRSYCDIFSKILFPVSL